MENTDSDNQELRTEDIFGELFAGSASASGEEELLRLGATFARQLSANQLKTIVFVKAFAKLSTPKVGQTLNLIIDEFLKLKQFHRSDMYVMRMFESLALRRFLNENSIKVNVQK